MSDTVSGDMLAIASDLRAHGLYALATRLEAASVKVRRQERTLDRVHSKIVRGNASHGYGNPRGLHFPHSHGEGLMTALILAGSDPDVFVRYVDIEAHDGEITLTDVVDEPDARSSARYWPTRRKTRSPWASGCCGWPRGVR